MLQLNDSIFEGYYNMARVKYAQDDIDECIKHCKRGLQIKSYRYTSAQHPWSRLYEEGHVLQCGGSF